MSFGKQWRQIFGTVTHETLKGVTKPHLNQNGMEVSSDSDSFQPQYHQIKRLGLKPNKKKLTVGNWSVRQNQTYLNFMMENSADFQDQKSRRKSKVFYRLSKILRRRTPDQCRSHHQKLQLKYRDDLMAIMHEVHRKIQRGLAELYVNRQHQIHLQRIAQLKKDLKTGLEPIPPETEIGQGWYRINANISGVLRIFISSEAIKSWSYL